MTNGLFLLKRHLTPHVLPPFWFQLAIQTPTATATVDSEVVTRALYTVTDITFGGHMGKNVLCANPLTDLMRAYPTSFERTSSLDTFMQVTTFVQGCKHTPHQTFDD